jgi:hypothetical protein
MAVSWNGMKIEFDGSLNCLIGARGTGKTTVLEFIRYAIGAMPTDPAARRRIEPLIEENLAGGRVQLSIETKDGLSYIISRAAGDEGARSNAWQGFHRNCLSVTHRWSSLGAPWAATVLGDNDDKEAVSVLIDLLTDKNCSIAAFTLLRKWTGITFNFDREKTEEGKAASIERWRKWWQTNSGFFEIRRE